MEQNVFNNLMVAGSFLVTVLTLLYFYLTKHHGHWRKKNVKHDKPNFLFGNVFKVLTGQMTIGHLVSKYYIKGKGEPYFGFYVFTRPSLVIRDPNIIKSVLVKNFGNFHNRNMNISKNVDEIGHYNIFANHTPRWRPARGNLSPMFTSGRIKQLLLEMKNIGNMMVKVVKPQSEVSTLELCYKYTTDIITSVIFGLEPDSLTNPNSKFREFGKAAFEQSFIRTFQWNSCFLCPPLANFFRFRLFSTETTNFFSGLFWDVINAREKNYTKRNDMIDLLIQLKNQGVINENETNDDDKKELEKSFKNFAFTRGEILSAAVTFFAAGFETTGSTMCFTLYELALNQDLQNKLRTQLFDLKEKHGSINYDVLRDAKLLGWCVDETLRKYPLVPWLVRECTQDFELPEQNLVIEKGTNVYIALYAMQHDPKYFKDPETYDPERFSDERKEEIVPFTYLPFGDGPRNCIGMRFGIASTKNGIAQLLTHYKIEPTTRTPKKLRFTNKSILLAPTEEIYLKYTPLD